VLHPRDPEQDDRARQFRLKNIERCVAAAKEQPNDTVMLRSDLLTPGTTRGRGAGSGRRVAIHATTANPAGVEPVARERLERPHHEEHRACENAACE
jgi:hypothetical protein